MELFTKSTPNLINENIMFEMEKSLNPVNEIKINDGLGYIYTEIIKPNMFFIILSLVFLLILYWKYQEKQIIDKEKKHRKHKKHKKDKKIKVDNSVDEFIKTLEETTNKYIGNNENNNENINENINEDFNPAFPVGLQPPSCDRTQLHVPATFDTANTYHGLHNNYNNAMPNAVDNYDYYGNPSENQILNNATSVAVGLNNQNIAYMNQFVKDTNNNLSNNYLL